MFTSDADIERDCLRQGDILEAIPFPILDLKSIAVLGKIQDAKTEIPVPRITPILQPHREDPNFFTAQVRMRMCYCAVTSHCCELEPRNGKLLPPSFSVARLIYVKGSILSDSEKLESLRANKNPITGGYLDYFYIGAHEKLGTENWMVDYSQIISIPNSDFPDVLRRKILQMDDRNRVKFKIKLAAYLGRITDEEDQAGLRMPW